MAEPQALSGVAEVEETQPPPVPFLPENVRQEWVSTYLATCKEYQVTPSSDVVSCFKQGLDTLKLYAFSGAAPFLEIDLQPLAETFDKHPAALERLRTMNFKNAKLGPSGFITIADWVRRDHCKVEVLHLDSQLPGAAGMDALLSAIRSNKNKTLKELYMPSCYLGDKGAAKIAELLEEGLSSHGIAIVDLENNRITFDMLQRLAAIEEKPELLNVEGNQVFDEVLNAISHGIGVVLAIIGTVFMGLAVVGKPGRFSVAVVIYSISLHTLYLASCLFHAFQSIGPRVRGVFNVFDHAAIYFLIAGSFAPFILVHLPDKMWVLYAQLIASFFGVGFTAFYHGPGKVCIEVTLYLIMGWAIAPFMGDLSQSMGPDGTFLLVLGGVLYTLGVPFFARQKRILSVPDHTTWHFFVLGGSVAHWFCIYNYCFACMQGKLSEFSSCPCLEGISSEWCGGEELLLTT